MSKRNPWCCICGGTLKDDDIFDNHFPYHVEHCRHQSCNDIFKDWLGFFGLDELWYYTIRVSYLEDKFLKS